MFDNLEKATTAAVAKFADRETLVAFLDVPSDTYRSTWVRQFDSLAITVYTPSFLEEGGTLTINSFLRDKPVQSFGLQFSYDGKITYIAETVAGQATKTKRLRTAEVKKITEPRQMEDLVQLLNIFCSKDKSVGWISQREYAMEFPSIAGRER